MKRLLSGAVGAPLLLLPAFFFFTALVPVAAYRKGTYADYGAAVASFLTLYGGAAVGVLVEWRLSTNRWLTARTVFRAGLTGAIVAIGVVIIAQAGLRWLTTASANLGNLWGLVVIFGAAFGVMVAAGAGLVWFALHGPIPKDPRPVAERG